MDTFGQIAADARRSREQALTMLTALEAGTLSLAPGMTHEKAVAILTENIAAYDAILSRTMRDGHA